MIRNILNKLWKSNNKQKVDGHWYVRLSDVAKLIDNAKFIEPEKTEEKLTMDDLASHLLDRGWIFERNPSTGDVFRRRVGDYDNREKIN
jgi:hypothetical protein